MRKLLGLIFIFLFTLSTLAFLVILNFRTGLFSAPRIKTLAAESNVYEIAAATVREQLAAQTGGSVDDGQLLEIITEAISAKNLQKVAESGIDSFFLAVSDPEHNGQIVIPTSELGREIITVAEAKLGVSNLTEVVSSQDMEGAPEAVKMLQEDQVIDLSSQPLFKAITDIQYLMLALLVPIIFWILLLVFVPSDAPGGRFAWLGSGFVFAGIALLAITLFYYLYAGMASDKIIAILDISDQKISLGLQKFLAIIADNQKVYFLAETIAALVIGFAMIILGRGMKEEKLAMLDDIPSAEVQK